MSQGQYQPPHKNTTAQPTKSAFRHIYSEDGDIKNSAKASVRTTGATTRTSTAARASAASASRVTASGKTSARPAVKAAASITIDSKPQSAAQKPNKSKKSPKPHGKIGQFLEKIPYAVGIALCVVLLLLSVYAGNARALSVATANAMKQWEVSEYIDGRVGEARNLLTLCDRNGISSEIVTALSDATDALDKVNASSVSRVIACNQALETAASNASAALLASDLSKSDETVLSSTMDDFREQGNFLRQQSRAYNSDIDDALALYEKLPTKFLLPRPQVANID